MRLLLDENMPASLAPTLRDAGHDVRAVQDETPGAADREVLAQAHRERRLIPTFDKDLGELAFKLGLPADAGVILFRLSGRSREADVRRVAEVLRDRSDWAGHFSVVTDERIRMRAIRSDPEVPDSR